MGLLNQSSSSDYNSDSIKSKCVNTPFGEHKTYAAWCGKKHYDFFGYISNMKSGFIEFDASVYEKAVEYAWHNETCPSAQIEFFIRRDAHGTIECRWIRMLENTMTALLRKDWRASHEHIDTLKIRMRDDEQIEMIKHYEGDYVDSAFDEELDDGGNVLTENRKRRGIL